MPELRQLNTLAICTRPTDGMECYSNKIFLLGIYLSPFFRLPLGVPHPPLSPIAFTHDPSRHHLSLIPRMIPSLQSPFLPQPLPSSPSTLFSPFTWPLSLIPSFLHLLSPRSPLSSSPFSLTPSLSLVPNLLSPFSPCFLIP